MQNEPRLQFGNTERVYKPFLVIRVFKSPHEDCQYTFIGRHVSRKEANDWIQQMTTGSNICRPDDYRVIELPRTWALIFDAPEIVTDIVLSAAKVAGVPEDSSNFLTFAINDLFIKAFNTGMDVGVTLNKGKTTI